MRNHIVEAHRGTWRVHAPRVMAKSPLQAVIRSAGGGGHYRARPTDHPVELSEYFWVPPWGQPEPVEPF